MDQPGIFLMTAKKHLGPGSGRLQNIGCQQQYRLHRTVSGETPETTGETPVPPITIIRKFVLPTA
jgi:hypothetical protein